MDENLNITTMNLKMFDDSPTENAQYFNFKSYVEGIYNIIVNPDNKTPFSIALNGKWGSGKTSLMLTLRKRLEKSSNEKSIRKIKTVWFNAWKYSETDSMLASLVLEIYNEMERQNIFSKQGLKDKIKIKFLKSQETIDKEQSISDILKLLSLGISPDFSKWKKIPEYEKHLPFYHNFKHYIEKILKFFILNKIEGRFDDNKGVLVIFIDDLDRCTPKSVANILESINLFFDQAGCIFIFGMDINLLSTAVKSHYDVYKEFSGEEYIRKMIQLQFNFPEIRKEESRIFIKKELITEGVLQKYIDLIIIGTANNPRQIKQTVNSIKFLLSLKNIVEGSPVDDELLIKWAILNSISNDFVNSIKIDEDLLFHIQAYSRLSTEDLGCWEESFKENTLSKFSSSKLEMHLKNFDKFSIDKNIIGILKFGTVEFHKENLSNYFHLVELAPIVPEKRYITIVVSGDQQYYIGEKIYFNGTSSAGKELFLMIKGPNKITDERKLNQLAIFSKNEDSNTFTRIEVENDFTWEYIWETSKIGTLLDEGIYTIYALEKPLTSDSLSGISYAPITIVFKKPYVIGQVDQSTYAQGDPIVIRGIAFIPNQKIQIWVFGQTENNFDTVITDSEGRFEYQLTKSFSFPPGEYYVVIQHPMMDNDFDVYVKHQFVVSNYPKKGTSVFKFWGPGSQKGVDAANILTMSIDNPAFDDTYTKLQFLIEKPTIVISPIPLTKKGEKISIIAGTNLAVGDKILFEISSKSFNPDQLELNQGLTGASGTVEVISGKEGFNIISFVVDTSTLNPDKYNLKISALSLESSALTQFMIKP